MVESASEVGVVRLVAYVSPHPSRTSLLLIAPYATKPSPSIVTGVPPSTRPPVGEIRRTMSGCTK